MLIRRIRSSEQEELSELCQSDCRWHKYFINHNSWVNLSLRDVSSRNRVVFGAFSTSFGEGDAFQHKLIACLFLKKSQFEDAIEFKNLILPTDEVSLDVQTSMIARQLIDKATRFCEVRSIRKVEIELPQEEHNIISIFLSLQFKVVALRDRYNHLNKMCILERSIGNTYHGDPFNTIKLANWLLMGFLPCDIVSQENVNDFVKISFACRSLSPSFSKANPVGERKRLRGVMWVIEDSDISGVANDSISEDEESLNTLIQSSQAECGITLLLADHITPKYKAELLKRGITYFDKEETKELAGGFASSLDMPILAGDVGGIVTALEYERIIEYSRQESLTYYLLSGLHEGLSLPEEEPLILALYCPNWEDQGGGIVGYCEIIEIRRRRFSEIRNGELPEDSTLSVQDLTFYGTYSEDERVASLQCSRIYLFQNLLTIKDGDWISDEDVKEYLDREILKNLRNAAYLDLDSCNSVRSPERLRRSPIPFDGKIDGLDENHRFRVGISFPGEERRLIRRVAQLLVDELGEGTVFYDRFYQSQLARTDLDIYLSRIYRNRCDLIVLFTSADYERKRWCNLEWRNIRELIFSQDTRSSIMPLRLDSVRIEGFLDIDGYIEVDTLTPEEIVQHILNRLGD